MASPTEQNRSNINKCTYKTSSGGAVEHFHDKVSEPNAKDQEAVSNTL